MPNRERDEETGAIGRPALRAFRDDDWESFVAAVTGLPEFRAEHGRARALLMAQVELPSLVAILSVGEPRGPTAWKARAAIRLFWTRPVAVLLTENSPAGEVVRLSLLQTVAAECFGPSAASVFYLSPPKTERPYLPSMPSTE